MRPPRAVVFDLDGTLIDSRRDIARACNHALGAVGRAPLPEATIAGFVGEGARLLCARALGCDEHDPAVTPALAAFVAYYRAHPADATGWLPGVEATLAALAGWPLAICTNKPREVVDEVLRALGAAARFQALVAGGDTPERKPSPAPLRAVADLLGVAVEHTWLIGDSPIDVATARAAGAVAIAVEGGFSTRDELLRAAPDALLARMAELPSLVRGTPSGQS